MGCWELSYKIDVWAWCLFNLYTVMFLCLNDVINHNYPIYKKNKKELLFNKILLLLV